MGSWHEPGPSQLPPHVQELMYGPKGRRKFPRHFYQPTGLLSVSDLDAAISVPPKTAPWLADTGVKTTNVFEGRKVRRETLARPKHGGSQLGAKGKTDKYAKFDKMIDSNQYKKISFINDYMSDIIPQWCLDRLRTACRSARFELPFDKYILETLTPLQFLAKYTRLYREQRRRYSRIFQKHKSKFNDYIEQEKLYPALNTMFGMFLSTENFDRLCVALFIDSQTVMDETTFIGVCTFADRLFWTSYLTGLDRDTFDFLGPNRSVLEYVDFDYLQRKIDGIELSKEMYYLLRSLA